MKENLICKYGETLSVCHLSPMDCQCILDESLNQISWLDELQKLTEKEYYDPMEYELYVMGYDSAKDKLAYNSGYFIAENKSEFILEFLSSEEGK